MEAMAPFEARSGDGGVFGEHRSKGKLLGEHARRRTALTATTIGAIWEREAAAPVWAMRVSSPEEAIETVGNRTLELVHEKHLIAGATHCLEVRLVLPVLQNGHSPESVAKWISDVSREMWQEVPSVFSDSRFRSIQRKKNARTWDDRTIFESFD